MSTDSTAVNSPRESETDRGFSGHTSRNPTPLRKSNHLFAAAALLVGLIIVAGLIAVLWESARLSGSPTAAANGLGKPKAGSLPNNTAETAQTTARLIALRTFGTEARDALAQYE